MTPQLRIDHRGWSGLVLGALLTMWFAFYPSPGHLGTASAITSTPTPDRLAEPALPANPTQFEQGRYLYWMHCMTCHGDRGQGLTDEFRGLWVEDHQNCWARGCHTGRQEDQGFPIPRTVPAIISSSGDLPPFASVEALFEYLRATHPPPHPGYLLEEEYWALTAYVLAENRRLPTGQEIGPRAGPSAPGIVWGFVALGLLVLIATAILAGSRRRRGN